MHYVLDEKGNKVEGLSKEEVLSVLQQAINDGSLEGIVADSAFVSKIKCCVGGETFGQAFVTQAKYNELQKNNQLIPNTLYHIIDDTTEEVLEDTMELFDSELKGESKLNLEQNNQLKTIEERLTQLGFKEGTIEFDSSLTIEDDSVRENYLHRQGNYVLGSLITRPIYRETTLAVILGKVPTEFLPKQEEEFIACYGYSQSGGLTSCHLKIDTDGNVSITNLDWTESLLPSFSVRIGYEAKPLTQ